MNAATFVGLDVHARSIKAVALDAMTGEVRTAAFGYDAAEVAERVGSLDPAAKCVCESGVTGFDLQKGLAALGVDRVVGAVSKTIKPSAGRRRKNDRNDAEFPARMLSVGNVVEVRAPDDGCEAARDLVRALDDAREDLERCRQRLSEFLRRHGYAFVETTPTGRRKGSWTAARWAWTRPIEFPEKADGDVLAYCVDAVRQAMEDKKRLEKPVGAEASRPRWKERVDSLRRLRGADAMTAADIAFEAGEFSRFKNARSFAAWPGLTPSEHPSGESVRQGGITKAGDKHLRRVLVESAWRYLGCSPHSKDLAKGQVPDPSGERARGQGREKARREAARDARARRPQEQGQRRHRPRARVPVPGGGLHGRGRLGRNGRLSRHSAIHPILRPYPRPLGLTPGPFSASAQGATRDTRLSNRPRQPQP